MGRKIRVTNAVKYVVMFILVMILYESSITAYAEESDYDRLEEEAIGMARDFSGNNEIEVSEGKRVSYNIYK